jgi:hypothetical protein
MNAWIIIRDVSTDELSVVEINSGQRIEPMSGYRYGGPYTSQSAAKANLRRKDGGLRVQLYGSRMQPPFTVR